MNNFKITHKEGRARVGLLKTSHGEIETPNFNPVGTQATVKALSPKDLEEIGVQMVLANTYHLMLRPGADLIEKFGGLHKFMGWDRPIMTDSGGYQVFSLGVALEHGDHKVLVNTEEELNERPRLNQISEKGVLFSSHLDGSKHFLGPEESMKIQHQLGADLIVAFDDHESSHHTYDEMLASLELTERWGLRSLKEYRRQLSAFSLQIKNKKNLTTDDRYQSKIGGLIAPLMYGVVHGGTHQDLRVRSAKFTDENFEAVAIGGIYGSKKELYQIIDWVIPEVSEDKIKHLLGIGEVADIFEAVERGIDMFDCVAPTRRARNGSLYISPKSGGNRKNNFTLNIRQSKFKADKKPIDPNCSCYTCQNFSKAYLRHLFMANELLFHQLATYHNIFFMTKMVEQIRNAIKKGEFKKLKISWLK